MLFVIICAFIPVSIYLEFCYLCFYVLAVDLFCILYLLITEVFLLFRSENLRFFFSSSSFSILSRLTSSPMHALHDVFSPLSSPLAYLLREKFLLTSKGQCTTADFQRATSVVTHEFTHQWFGDLVTPASWNYAWLNEAFARLFEYFGTRMVRVNAGVATWSVVSGGFFGLDFVAFFLWKFFFFLRYPLPLFWSPSFSPLSVSA